ncbi:aldolase/citrate lyase family protein [Shewanella sp. AS1]|uniref:aldolase/citrate lyase family protein n=1 Tax=Shewanella sp. AS1 TaxID=2907626 RepID=UPI001F2427B6|nr:aldolase/citrate lyase family protein [Shewanella sp. AS1]MCE9679180.1 aldolase/citrate lyase family protein [Shewanella sp. AS1]
MQLMILTNEPKFALEAELAGVNRIFVDLEYLNKAERQRGLNTVLSNHTIEDVKLVRSVLRNSHLLVRINPINPTSKNEIDSVIENGADIIMLPMAFDANDARDFVEMVNGRAKTIVMIETAQALSRIDDLISVEGIDEFFIGLNDLKISLGLNFMFEVLSGGLVEYMVEKIQNAGGTVGFGGIAKLGEGDLPAELILSEHVRLNSNSVILSRTFKNDPAVSSSSKKIDLKLEVSKLKDKESKLKLLSNKELVENKIKLKDIVNDISDRIQNNVKKTI